MLTGSGWGGQVRRVVVGVVALVGPVLGLGLSLSACSAFQSGCNTTTTVAGSMRAPGGYSLVMERFIPDGNGGYIPDPNGHYVSDGNGGYIYEQDPTSDSSSPDSTDTPSC